MTAVQAAGRAADSSIELVPGDVDTPRPSDHFSPALLRALWRAPWPKLARGPLVMFAVGVVTLGVAPLLDWQRRLRQHGHWERHQFWHLTEWLRLRSGPRDVDELAAMAERIGERRWWCWAVCGGAALFVVGLVILAANGAMAEAPLRRASMLGAVVLGPAYFVYGIGLLWHVRDVRRFAHRLNELAVQEGAPSVRRPSALRVAPAWAVGALAFACVGWYWGCVMMVVGGLHAGYVRVSAVRFRADAAQVVRSIMSQQSMFEAYRQARLSAPACSNSTCKAEGRQGIAFCPRCGTPAGGRLDLIA